MRFTVERTAPRLTDTPRFGNLPEAEPDPGEAIRRPHGEAIRPDPAIELSQLISGDSDEDEEEIPDEGSFEGHLEPLHGAPLFTRNWCI